MFFCFAVRFYKQICLQLSKKGSWTGVKDMKSKQLLVLWLSVSYERLFFSHLLHSHPLCFVPFFPSSVYCMLSVGKVSRSFVWGSLQNPGLWRSSFLSSPWDWRSKPGVIFAYEFHQFCIHFEVWTRGPACRSITSDTKCTPTPHPSQDWGLIARRKMPCKRISKQSCKLSRNCIEIERPVRGRVWKGNSLSINLYIIAL